jgi:serine/threonine protein kinase/Flp pilus assembly protein TadD
MRDDAEYDDLVMTLVESAVQRPPDRRDSFIRSACGQNSQLYEDVRSRVDWEERMEGFLREPLLPARDLVDRPFEPGQLVAERFRIIRQAGQGGMGIVYEAIDTKVDRKVAIKCSRLGFRNRISPEVRAAREVSHYNICKVHELHSVDTPSGQIDFLTMEFIEGETLAARLKRSGPIPEAEARQIVFQIASGLAQAHRQDVIHGDLKPGNVILAQSHDGGLRAVITDFGLAKFGKTAGIIISSRGGTLDYMAPEILAGGRATISSDVYALGVMIHEMLCGRTPRPAESTVWELLLEPLPKPWPSIVQLATDGRPEARYPSASALAEDIDPPRAKRRLAVLTAALVAVSGVAAFSMRSRPEPPPLRLAVLPASVSGDPLPSINGVVWNAANRLAGARKGLLVFTPSDAIRQKVATPAEAASRLGATHALRTTAERHGQTIEVHAALMAMPSGRELGRLNAAYPAADPAAIAKALVGTVTGALDLKPVGSDRVAKPAYADYMQGMALLRSEFDPTKSMPFLERAAQLDPASALPLAALGEAQAIAYGQKLDRNWLVLAEATVARAASLSPDSAEALLAQGTLARQTGRHEQAVQYLTRASRLDPANVEVWTALARAYESLNRPDQALATYHKAIEVQPDHFRHLLNLFAFHFYRGEHAEAEAVIRKLIAVAPGMAGAHTNLGAVLMHEGRFAEAESEIRESLRLEDGRTGWYLLGGTCFYQRRFTDAAAHLEKLIAMGNPSSAAWHALGDTYHFLGREREARSAYQSGLALTERAVVEDPHDSAIRAQLGLFAAFLGDSARADYETAQAIKLSPEQGTVMRIAAETYEALGRRDQTLLALRGAPPATLADIARTPEFSALQTDSRFQELLSAENNRK